MQTEDAGVPAPDHDAWLQTTLEALIAETGAPALGAIIIDRSGPLAQAVAGKREVGAPASVTLEDVWQLGSITKTFTTMLVDSLAQESLLSWDSTLGSIFSEIQMPAEMAAVTMRELAEHRSGFRRDPERSWIPEDPALSLFERRHALVVQAVRSSLGEKRYAYSNLGFHILGAAAERVTGQPWEALIQTRIAEPLGMDSVIFGEPRASSKEAPSPHVLQDGVYESVEPLVGDIVYDTLAPAGHVSCDLADAARYLLGRLSISVEEPQTWFRQDAPAGLGLRLNHTGSNGRNFALAELFPESNIALLIVSNAAGAPAERAVREARNAIMERFAPQHVPTGLALEGEALAIDDWSADLTVQSFSGLSGEAQLWWSGAQQGDQITLRAEVPSGRYELFGNFCFASDYGQVQIEVSGQRTSISFNAESLEWRERSLGIFELDGALRLTFEAMDSAGENGVVCHLGLDQLRLVPVP